MNNIKMPTEHQECCFFARLLAKCPYVIKYSKIPMEIRTPSLNQLRKHKLEWMMKGVPDYEIITKDIKWKKHLVKIEMKRKKWWVASKEQKERMQEYEECWIHHCIADWAIEAFKFLKDIIEWKW